MATTYTSDLYAWANEQAHFLNTGLFTQVDILHLTKELELMGNSELSEIVVIFLPVKK